MIFHTYIHLNTCFSLNSSETVSGQICAADVATEFRERHNNESVVGEEFLKNNNAMMNWIKQMEQQIARRMSGSVAYSSVRIV